MITLAEAEAILNRVSFAPGTERVALLESLGRVLAEDIVSPIAMPPFDKSAMDGYAVRSGDDAERFTIVETIAAGAIPLKPILPGQCARIMTGAMLPPGADRVIKFELTREEDQFMIPTGRDDGGNICFLGEDIRPGDVVVKRGALIRPQEIGIMASVGFPKAPVFLKPKVGIVATGSEIVPPGQPLERGKIYNSNAYSIAAQVFRCGAEVVIGRSVEDEEQRMADVLEEMIRAMDMVLISGGVSMGDFDFVPGVLRTLGVDLLFKSVAIQPGKPTVFGRRGKTVVFGLPGNPVSTFTIFEIFVRRILYKMAGHDYMPEIRPGRLAKDYRRKHAERNLFTPVFIDESGLVHAITYHGSAHFSSLALSNALLPVAAGVMEMKAGTEVYVRQV